MEDRNLNSTEAWVIPTSELVVGSTLNFDLTDSQAVVLHKAGDPISQRLLDRLLQKNIHSVSVKGQLPNPADSNTLLLSYFDKRTIEATNRIIAKSEKALLDFSHRIQNGESGDTEELLINVEQFLAQATDNASAMFAVLATRASQASPELAADIASRSTRMALMGVTVAVTMDFKPEDCLHIGMAGLLHDSSLLMHPEWFNQENGIKTSSKALADFRNHPIESADLLSEAATGVSESVFATIEQVHEQLDGSGYPNGLLGNGILNTARVLNVVDAYLELIQPLQAPNHTTPSDALAYICHHAATQQFDLQIVRGLIVALSLYPIGSIVELNDGALAVVVSSNPSNPMEPIVKLLFGKNDIEDLLDSDRSIAKPYVSNDPTLYRIPKSKMDSILWRCDMVDHGA